MLNDTKWFCQISTNWLNGSASHTLKNRDKWTANERHISTFVLF